MGDYAFNGSPTFEYSNLTLLPSLKSIEIGDNCFENVSDYCFINVKTFQIDGLNRLESLKIGKNSFVKNYIGIDASKSFHILNCESLESIQIGGESFNDYAGDFELKNLPLLQSIQIGTVDRYSSNFRHSSFVIGGIYI